MLRDCYERTFDEDVQPSTNDCPECGGRVTTTAHETVCDDCGLMIDEEPIDHGPEWRSFEDETTNPKRTGAPLTATRHDRGLSTEIGQTIDATGSPLSRKKRRQMSRLRREHDRGRFQSKAERNLAHGLEEVRRIASALALSDSIRDQACQLIRSAQDADLLPGRSIEAVAAASVHGACRCNGLSRTLAELTDVARVDHSRVTSAYKVLNETLSLPTRPVTPSAFVPQLASKLDVRDSTRRRARRLAEAAEADGETNGYKPAGFAAACIYKANHEQGSWLTQTRAADAADTTATTVRRHQETLADLSI